MATLATYRAAVEEAYRQALELMANEEPSSSTFDLADRARIRLRKMLDDVADEERALARDASAT
jgi:hypothetical protein